jgi:hypothetical protein
MLYTLTAAAASSLTACSGISPYYLLPAIRIHQRNGSDSTSLHCAQTSYCSLYGSDTAVHTKELEFIYIYIYI